MHFNDFYQINQKTPLSNKGMQTCILMIIKLTKKTTAQLWSDAKKKEKKKKKGWAVWFCWKSKILKKKEKKEEEKLLSKTSHHVKIVQFPSDTFRKAVALI